MAKARRSKLSAQNSSSPNGLGGQQQPVAPTSPKLAAWSWIARRQPNNWFNSKIAWSTTTSNWRCTRLNQSVSKPGYRMPFGARCSGLRRTWGLRNWPHDIRKSDRAELLRVLCPTFMERGHFLTTPHDDRRALMDVMRIDVQDSFLPRKRGTTGLFGKEGNRIGFVH